MFSLRSCLLKDRLRFKPLRTLSPSKPYAGIPWFTKIASTWNEMEVFPAPDKPVSHTVQPRKPRMQPIACPRFARDTWCACSDTFEHVCKKRHINFLIINSYDYRNILHCRERHIHSELVKLHIKTLGYTLRS